jgi:hypothetical protein
MLENDVYNAEFHNLTNIVKVSYNWKYVIGVYREMWMEYWQSHGIDNVDFESIVELQNNNPNFTYPDVPASIRRMYYLLHMELPSDWYAAAVKDIAMQYNAGRRAS